MSQRVVEMDEVELYLRCPRKVKYYHQQGIAPRGSEQDEQQRVEFLRTTITEMLANVSDEPTEDSLKQEALRVLEEHWPEYAPEYQSPNQRSYDHQAIRQAMQNYIEDHGVEHAENLIDTNVELLYDMGGSKVRVEVDALTQSDSNVYEACYFINDLSGVVGPSPYNTGSGYVDGEYFYPETVGSALRSVATVEAVENAYSHEIDGPFMTFFNYIGLLDTAQAGGTDESGAPQVDIKSNIQKFYPTNHFDDMGLLERLIKTTADNIRNSEYSAQNDHWESIRRYVCPDCSYSAMCPDYINSEQ